MTAGGGEPSHIIHDRVPLSQKKMYFFIEPASSPRWQKAEHKWLTIYMHWGVNRSEWRATLHMASIQPFVFVLYFVDNKNAVEDNGNGSALANSLPYRRSLLCLERKCMANVGVVIVHARSDSISQIIPEINILCWEANPPDSKMFRNSNRVSTCFEYLPQERSLACRLLQMDFRVHELSSFSQPPSKTGSITALLQMKRLKWQRPPWAGNSGLWSMNLAPSLRHSPL